jgi:hypothetical protein
MAVLAAVQVVWANSFSVTPWPRVDMRAAAMGTPREAAQEVARTAEEQASTDRWCSCLIVEPAVVAVVETQQAEAPADLVEKAVQDAVVVGEEEESELEAPAVGAATATYL